MQLNKSVTRLALCPVILSRKLSHSLIVSILHTTTAMRSGPAIGAGDGNARATIASRVADCKRRNEGSAVGIATVERVGGLLFRNAEEEGLIERFGEQDANLVIVFLVVG